MIALYNALAGFTHDFLRRYTHDSMLQESAPTATNVLNVMALDFTYKAAIRGYNSVVIERVWNGTDKFQMSINSEVTNAGLIAIDDVVWFDNEYHKGFIIEKIEETLQGDTIEHNITGTGLTGLLKDFITVPPDLAYDVATGTREEVVRQWVINNASRNSYTVALGTYSSLGETITDQTRYKNLATEVERVLSAEDLGYTVSIDTVNSRFVFDVAKGTDRTINAASYAPRVLFGLKFGNLASYRKTTDKMSEKNFAFVGGSGEEAERVIATVDESSTRRKEIFVDARDVTATGELAERGSQYLSETAIVDGFEFEALNRQFAYETDYDLGDFITVVKSVDESQDLQITGVIETYEVGNIQTEISFGKPTRTIGGAVTSVSTRVAKLETYEQRQNMVQLINGTGATSVKGKLVDINADMTVRLCPVGIPDCIGVISEDGIAPGELMWVVFSGPADVYFTLGSTAGHLARSTLSVDSGAVAGEAKSEAVPTSPFATDKHFCEIGHVLESRTGAGLAKCMLHFN